MKIRLIGTPAECTALTDALFTLPDLFIGSVSEPYPSHRHPAHVRVYIDAYPCRDIDRGGRP
ncbi:hypothetical protein [Actinoplanes sp. NPDC020271]|uniref:hypothetical protein n=1 Tax=Actinoplanes sp. NPDC020271 TaxID=3363896 RepID=UPI0037A249A8